MKPERLSIEGEIFADLRRQMNLAMESCIAKMRETGMHEGSVGVKIGLQITDSEFMIGADMRVDSMKIDAKVSICLLGYDTSFLRSVEKTGLDQIRFVYILYCNTFFPNRGSNCIDSYRTTIESVYYRL